jgi:5-methylcytosine-specific restriction enzyme subunit McrC
MIATETATLTLGEYETIRTGALSAAQVQALAHQFGSYVSVSPTWGDEVELRAGSHVGIIVLDGLQIVIEPKVPLDNLFYMLTYAYDLPQFRDERIALENSAALFKFIVQMFVRQVERLVRRGMYQTYVDRSANERFLRGRLSLQRHLHENAVHLDRFAQSLNEFTADVLENRILHYTLFQLSRLGAPLDQSVRRELRRTLSAFAHTSLTPVTAADCRSVIYTRLNAAYHPAINLAQLLLQHLSLEAHRGDHSFVAYLFDMNAVFELFVARYLAQAMPQLDPRLQVDIQPSIWLDLAQKERGVPDIAVRRDGQRVLFLDTKYKRHQKPDGADLYQMVTYCYSVGVPDGILIYPQQSMAPYNSKFKDVTVQTRGLALDGNLDSFRTRCLGFARWFAQQAGGAMVVAP